MAGDWIKVELSTPDKPEIIRISELLGIDQDAAFGKCIRVWMWADQQTEDGNALTVTFAFLDRITCCKGFGNALREVGWLSGKDGCMKIPNFTRHNGVSGKSRAVTNDRVKRFRNGDSVTEALPEKRREEKTEEQCIAASPPEEPKPAKQKPVKAPRPRDEIFDTLADQFHLTPESKTDAGLIGKVATSLKAKGATPDEIKRRIRNYQDRWPDMDCTITALDKHWATCANAPPQDPEEEGDDGEWHPIRDPKVIYDILINNP